ncbi:MAG: acyl carrier protein [Phycisphaerae bacterium]|nr:acyl carrier protein [Phycisphaerae bacterium]
MSERLTLRVKAVMAVTFNTTEEQIGDDASIMQTPGWDSLGHASLMLALEEEFGVELSEEAILELQSLPEIVAHLTPRVQPDG